MCGISATINNSQDAITTVIEALSKLQNRGYDSVGIAAIVNGHFKIKKFISENDINAISKLKTDDINNFKSRIAIGHTRWATHGKKTIENAHPHTDQSLKFALVHNGIIENYKELRDNLLSHGYKFYGETDTETIVKLLSFLSDNDFNYKILSHGLHGSWAIVFIDRELPDRIYFLKNGSPLIIGYDNKKSKIMLVSELTGFDTDIDNYIVLQDDEYGFVQLTNDHMNIITRYTYTVEHIQQDKLSNSPSPYSHWTIKEINEQPYVIQQLLDTYIIDNQIKFSQLEKIKNELIMAEHFVFIACGTSYHAAQFGSKFFKKFNNKITIDVIDGADFEPYDIPDRRTILFLLSQSGETKDLYRVLSLQKKNQINVKTVGLVNVENSLIAREVDACIYLKAGRENAVASTKCYSNQIVTLLLLALYLNPGVENSISSYLEKIKDLPHIYDLAIKTCQSKISNIVKLFQNQNDCFILGRQQCEWTAKEASLKIKEISYIHSEGYSAAALKHGPFALLAPNVPVIIIGNDDCFYSKIENVIQEVSSRNAKIIFITNSDKHNNTNTDIVIQLKSDPILFPFVSIVPLQILAYELSINRGINPDYPRNLAKVVTVE